MSYISSSITPNDLLRYQTEATITSPIDVGHEILLKQLADPA